MSLTATDLNQDTSKMSSTSVKGEKAKLPPQLVELKNGKVIFRQKPISFENMSETMQEIVKFRECVSKGTRLKLIPDEHLPLIAKMVHESDKPLPNLVKSLQTILVPPMLGSTSTEAENTSATSLSSTTLENAVKTVAERINYGIPLDTEKPPATLSVWRWEVKNKDWLPDSVKEVTAQRLEERKSAKIQLQSLFDALPEAEREVILSKHKASKPKAEPASEEPTLKSSQNTADGNDKPSEDAEAKKANKSKKPVDPEALAKEKERQERKLLKVEKEKKEAEAKKKSAAAFANFFKPKAAPATEVAGSSSSSSSTAPTLTEFEQTFRSFVPKRDMTIAPTNWFLKQKGLGSSPKKIGCKDVPIEIEDDDVTESSLADVDSVDVSQLGPRELLSSFIQSTAPSLHPSSRILAARRQFKAGPKYCVRTIIQRLNEAEVEGDQREVRRLNSLLKNRKKVPVKVLVFAENVRPGYLGTWTRPSPTVRPRKPLALDIISFDYTVDSDAEWEEDDAGEDVESVDESMEDDDATSIASDLDGWLVEGDEIEMADVEMSPSPPAGTNMKRKKADSHESQSKKRKVVPLIPFQKGPVWENEIGKTEYEPFIAMRIQFFNDPPYPIDPFTFVSTPAGNEIPKKMDGGFVIPPLPSHVMDLSTEESRNRRKAVAAPPPKTSFPDAHIPLLLTKIRASNTSSFVVLLDLLFQDLKSLGVKKNALEVKLREVAEKDKVKKSWVVKDAAWTQHGVPIPTN